MEFPSYGEEVFSRYPFALFHPEMLRNIFQYLVPPLHILPPDKLKY